VGRNPTMRMQPHMILATIKETEQASTFIMEKRRNVFEKYLKATTWRYFEEEWEEKMYVLNSS
ncbi:hypothetical protein H312_03101, partial [Anncaliia algerae PRA339]